MARNTSGSYSFLIETIKELPVIASQDQEFWLAAAISCVEVIDSATKKTATLESSSISGILLVNVFNRCTGSYDELIKTRPRQSTVPSLDQILVEAIEARERIFQFRVSRLLKCLNGPGGENEDKVSAIKSAVEIAQCLSVLPLGFLSYWRSSLENHGRSPSSRSALLYFLDVDCTVLRGSIEIAAFMARQTLVQGYLRYGLRMALGYVNMGLEYSDLVQEVALGLVVAADKYVYLEHGRFAVFATTWMWQHITRSLANDGRLIRLPVHLVQRRNELQKELAQHLDESRHTGSLAALIESKGLNVDECLPILIAGVLPVRLDSSAQGLTKRDLEVLLASSADMVFQFDTYDRDLYIGTILRELSSQQRDVISLRFGLYADQKEHTLEEIGRRYGGLTRERIRQIEKKALEKLSRLAIEAQRDLSKGTETINHNRRVLEAISCDEALNAAHPYMGDDCHQLGAMLNRSFGSRQTLVRRGLTIKGRILAAFEMHGTLLHTREIYENLRVLFPFEDHLETTLYSVMAGSPGTFVSLGGGVFGLTTDADSVVTAQKATRCVSVVQVEEQKVFNEIDTEFLLEAPTDSASSSGRPGCKPESPEFPLQVMRRIFERSKEFREKGSWSIVELAWTPEAQSRLSQWARIGTADFRALALQRIVCFGSSFTGMESLAVTFLAFCSYVAQRSAAEGDMWTHVSASLGPQLKRVLFSGPGSPRRALRDATEEVCRKLRIRHAFGREGEQSWLRTVFLQIGLSRSGYNRLPFWLGQGAELPVAVQELISESSKIYSRTFSSLWMILQRFRWGSLEQPEAEAALVSNPWIRAEDRLDLLAAALSQREIGTGARDKENGEEKITTGSILTEPRLRWAGAVPVFEIGLLPSPPAWMDGERYILTIADHRVAVLRTGAEWRMDNVEGTLAFEPIQPILQANLVQRGVLALDSPLDIHLTPDPDPFGFYDLSTGQRVDAARSGRDFRRPTAILCRAEIVLPPSREFYRAFQGEWIFWAFREGLPPDFSIREGELTIWSPDGPYREAGPAIAPPKKLVVSSSGGWWGETARVSVVAPPNLQLLRLRLGSQRVELAPTQPGRFEGKLPLLAGGDYSASAQIECISEGRLERRTTDFHVSEINGVALETENGWKPFDCSRDIDIEYFQSRLILARLPASWMGEERKPEDWVFLEGDHFCQRNHRSVSSFRDSLYGVGEPLVLSIGPYNYSSPGRKLTRGLLNSGVIQWVSREHEHWELQLRGSLDLGEGYEIWAWLAGKDSPSQLNRDQWSQRENVCEVRPALDQSPEGFAISYHGAWLGARTASSGLIGLQQIIEHTPSWPVSARWLRWWRAPLLHESLKIALKTAVEADPVNTLAAWLTTDAPGRGAEYSDRYEDAWLSVVRGALWSWHPTPEQSRQAILRLGIMTGNPEIDLEKCWSGFEPLLAANPMLLAQLSASGIAGIYADFSQKERQIFLRMLQALILGLDRNASDTDLKMALNVCLTEAAESMNNSDSRFLTDSLLPLALRSGEGKLVQDLNLRIALANSPFRKLLAVALIRHATGEQPIRASL